MAKMNGKELSCDLTADEWQELNTASKRRPLFDEDSPELTDEMLQQFKRLHQKERIKQTVSLRISPATLKKAKMYGKGYTAFLSRLLDAAIQNDDMVRKCL